MTIPWAEQWRKDAEVVVRAVLKAADPATALAAHLRRCDGYTLRPSLRPQLAGVLASGKAAVAMARQAQRTLRRRLRGIVTAPEEIIRGEIDGTMRGLSAWPCDHPFPTRRNVLAARKVFDFVSSLTSDEVLLVLLSGGASAHLCLPMPGLRLADIALATRLIQRAGGDIRDLNTVRKHCEMLKGGRLAAACPAPIEAYILSDVLGNPLDVIASGPTAPDPTTYADALAVLKRYRLTSRLPRIAAHFRRGIAGEIPETPKEGNPVFERVKNTIIGDNSGACDGARDALKRLGYRIAGMERNVVGEASAIGRRLARRAASIVRPHAPVAYIIGGEWTVTVGDKSGKGGPSQELALAAARLLAGSSISAGVLAFSTDGVDGPTDAAGAIITNVSWQEARAADIFPDRALREHDSHRLLDRLGALIRTGPTGTNVNHVAILAAAPTRGAANNRHVSRTRL